MNLNIPEMLAKVKEMQERMSEAHERLRAMEVTAEVGGGMVKVRANGKQELLSISIEPGVVNPAEIAMLEDLVLAAVNRALEQSRDLAARELGSATNSMLPSIPGLDLGSLGLR